mmetsp:Transcript_31587/g.66422  ORF Transcript_31587/g.66422 Transcript_31587/m.66422 type:complete len:251 (+) Transcript_31587:84-836(+)|eukprot:CAMPEP_0172311844 /NCGR_PEP_ID=MMETSP1058-20130122/15807_1 /TAXON_ID=83371 /ORGANISM="Detonula confervacea, Strain CCMP 353" /LENGTH=250 /DNA_ID=CAMNT_0013025139 /DNA_START=49 /DNA_END=801 /DNA_ORIENTATION=-
MKSLVASLFLINSLAATNAFAASSASTLTLKYFDIRGAAETCRVLLAFGQEEYNDARYKIDPATFQSPEFLDAKKDGDLKMNLNRAPILLTPDGQAIGQSKAIERYLARRFGLMGQTPEDEAIIDCIAEHCRDVKDAARQKGFSAFTKNKTDEEKALARKEWFEDDLPEMLLKIEDSLQETSASGGYSFGNTSTYADVVIWALLRDCFAADVEDTAKAADKCTALNAIADQIASNPGVSKWLSERPESMF